MTKFSEENLHNIKNKLVEIFEHNHSINGIKLANLLGELIKDKKQPIKTLVKLGYISTNKTGIGNHLYFLGIKRDTIVVSIEEEIRDLNRRVDALKNIYADLRNMYIV